MRFCRGGGGPGLGSSRLIESPALFFCVQVCAIGLATEIRVKSPVMVVETRIACHSRARDIMISLQLFFLPYRLWNGRSQNSFLVKNMISKNVFQSTYVIFRQILSKSQPLEGSDFLCSSDKFSRLIPNQLEDICKIVV